MNAMTALRIKGFVELGGIILFIFGHIQGIVWAAMVGGVLLVITDILDIMMGILNPIFPIILAIILGSCLHPWYIGVFWASAAINMFNIPTNFIRIFNPKMIIDKMEDS